MKVCSSMVEHLAHNGKVASSNLVKPILLRNSSRCLISKAVLVVLKEVGFEPT